MPLDYEEYDTLDKVMLNLSEALLNLKDNYPNRDLANHSFGALGSYLPNHYTIPKAIMVFDEETGICRLRLM